MNFVEMLKKFRACYLKPQHKMLLFFLLCPEKYHSEMKKVEAEPHVRMGNNRLPGFLHALAPVNVVENKNRTRIFFSQGYFKITKGWLIGMVTVDVQAINGLKVLQQLRK